MKYKLACATLCYSPQKYNLGIALERISKIGFKVGKLISFLAPCESLVRLKF